MNQIIEDFKKWKEKHPDEDYQYDEVHNFLSNYSRGEIISFLEDVEYIYDNRSNSNP